MPSLKEAYAKYRTDGGLSLFITSIQHFLSVIYKRLNTTLIFPVIMFLSSRFSPKPGLVLFHNMLGYRGNSPHVYQWFLQQESGTITPVWVTHRLTQYIRMKRDGKPVIYLYSPRGLYYFATADLICYDTSGHYQYPDSSTQFKLRHEIPVKRGSSIEKDPTDEPQSDASVESAEKILNDQIHSKKHILYPSEFLAASESDESAQIAPFGFPRNDVLFTNQESESWEKFIQGHSYDLVVLYAPTVRQTSLELFPFDDFTKTDLVELLHELNALLLIRLHPNDRFIPAVTETMHEYPNLQQLIDELLATDYVKIADQTAFEETIDLLPYVDVLISDYSSVYHTFLQLDRPLLFFPYDYEKYYQRSGFKYDYFENLPGPAIDSFSEFESHLRSIASGEDQDQTKRHALRERLYDYDDGNSTERVGQYIMEISRVDQT